MNYQVLTLIILVIGLGLVIYFLIRKPKADQGLAVMLEWLKEMRGSTESMQKRIDDTNKAIGDRLDNAARVIGALQKELGGMTQIGPDIRRLSEVLASPKARGNFGEEILEQLLSQVLPRTSYEFQYKFRSGDVVDAIVRVGDQILPIDSKFSVENFRLYKEAKTEEAAEGLRKAFLRDVKKRIDEIHKKYILPQEKTFDFALMYIPSEGVFSEVLEDLSTLTYARDKKVYFVSPNTLYHHLQIILLSLRRQQINEAAHQILAMIAGIKQESDKFGRNLELLASHMKNAGNTMGSVLNDYGKLKTSIGNAATLKFENPEKQLPENTIEEID
jgi:DNA recombination protein RmuC